MDEDETKGLTLRELVLELRVDIKTLSNDTNVRLLLLERAGFRLRGAWSAIIIGSSALAGAAGLTIGLINLYQ